MRTTKKTTTMLEKVKTLKMVKRVKVRPKLIIKDSAVQNSYHHLCANLKLRILSKTYRRRQ